MANVAARLMEMGMKAQKITARVQLASKEFEVAMHKKDGVAMDAARAEMHDAIDSNFDAQVELNMLKEEGEKDMLAKLKKL